MLTLRMAAKNRVGDEQALDDKARGPRMALGLRDTQWPFHRPR